MIINKEKEEIRKELQCIIYPLNHLKNYKYVVVCTFYHGKYVLSRHKERKTWETQGGHIESGETPLDAAKRELYEESGLKDADIYPVCDYYGYNSKSHSNGMVFVALAHKFDKMPNSEMKEIKAFDELPLELTYPNVTPRLFKEAKNVKNTLERKVTKIKWIFFDVGSTLIDESKAYDHRVLDMIKGTDITFDEFDKKRIELAKHGLDGNSNAIKYFNLNKTPWHSEDETLFPNTLETLEYLYNQGYNLGIIANQVYGLEQRLDTWGLLKYFKVIVSSSEVGVSKPDKLIFEKALELSGCLPQDSVMIGDRIDNDIIPAKSIGMKTVWVKKGLSVYQNLENENEIVDWTINDLIELKKIFVE